MKRGMFLAFFIVLFLVSPVIADTCTLTLFHSVTCPHCADEREWLDEIKGDYPDLTIDQYEVSENYDLFKEWNEKYGSTSAGVPRTFIDGKVFIGFDKEDGDLEFSNAYQAYKGYKNQIEHSIKSCLGSSEENNTIEPVKKEQEDLLIVPIVLTILFLLFSVVFANKISKKYIIGTGIATLIIILYYLAHNLPQKNVLAFAKQFSFPVFTFIIALLDGFNPCAFAVLAVLLSLLIHTSSRRKMLLIGTIFITTSAVMYFLFIIVLLVLRAELLGAYKEPIRLIVGLIALTAGTINLKDFFFFKKGFSLTISSKKMSHIMHKMRGVINQVKEATTGKALFVAILGTIVVAALVNIIELGCTLILPVEYIEVLITNYGTTVSMIHYLYTAFYCVVYIIPLLVILALFTFTFKSRRMEEMQGRVLKLIGGLIMIGLGLILLFKPELLAFV